MCLNLYKFIARFETLLSFVIIIWTIRNDKFYTLTNLYINEHIWEFNIITSYYIDKHIS